VGVSCSAPVVDGCRDGAAALNNGTRVVGRLLGRALLPLVSDDGRSRETGGVEPGGTLGPLLYGLLTSGCLEGLLADEGVVKLGEVDGFLLVAEDDSLGSGAAEGTALVGAFAVDEGCCCDGVVALGTLGTGMGLLLG
jgi:hypothetical protein